MPTYEYQCNACGEVFEKFQSMSEEPLKDCPQCQAEGQVRRLISGGAGLLFKGSGFYITDYRSEGYKEAAKNDKPASETKTSKEASKTTAHSSSNSGASGSTSSTGSSASTK